MVAFFATLTSHAVHETTNQVVAFDMVQTNIGQAYDANAGRFTCPIGGVYVIAVTLQALAVTGTPPTGYAIMRNGVPVAKFYLDGTTEGVANYETSSQTAVLELVRGDTVTVVNRHADGGLHGDHYRLRTTIVFAILCSVIYRKRSNTINSIYIFERFVPRAVIIVASQLMMFFFYYSM